MGAHGREIFRRVCATCHRLDREGVAVSPDLLDMRNQPKENILFHIVAPDAEIAPAFAAYTCETKNGRSFAGILMSETPASITVRQPGGAEETVLRATRSKPAHRALACRARLMPTGLDAAMSAQDLADLLVYLKGDAVNIREGAEDGIRPSKSTALKPTLAKRLVAQRLPGLTNSIRASILFSMAKPSHRDVILSKGMEVMHRQGYNGTSVRDIVRAAGVPQGSFTNHFASKEAFGLEVLDLYYARSCKMMRETLGNEALSPLGRIRAYVEAYRSLFRQHGCQHGCLCGNFAAEASDQSEPLRKRMAEIFEDIRRRVVDCLKAAVKAGEVSRPMKYDEVANFIIGGLQGALLLGKSSRSLLPLDQFERILFAQVLR